MRVWRIDYWNKRCWPSCTSTTTYSIQKLESKNGLQSASERAAKSEGKRVAKIRSFAKQIHASSKRATAKPAEQQPERVRICLNL